MNGTAPFPSRIPRYFRKVITFDGTTGAGAVGTVAVATVTGAVWIQALCARCTTNLAGASATIELGTSGNTAALIAQTTATDIDASEFWQDASPESKVSPTIVNQSVCANIIATVGTAAITAGVLEIEGYWLPLSPDGMMS